MNILITGFEPFDGQTINPSIEILNRIQNNYNHVYIYKLIVPTVFNESIEVVCKKVDEIHPDIVLMLGQAGGRKEISIERVAINIDDANIPDNRGIKPIDSVIMKNGQPAYFSSLPIKKMMNILRENNLPAQISNSAGTYVCNHLMYGVLNHIDSKKLNILAGFVHVPFIHEQVIDNGNFSMSLNDLVKAVELLIEIVSEDKYEWLYVIRIDWLT